jgi:hypothetical protein
MNLFLIYFILLLDGDTQGLRIASATYLKNFIRGRMDIQSPSPQTHKEFRNQLASALLKVDQAVLRVLIEAVCIFSSSFLKSLSN